MKQYRLLRDNKESGPFSFEEITALGFKPYDLLWIDGKSAGWRYPSEMEEFKALAPIVEEQPYDRFYKRPTAPVSKIATETAKAAPLRKDKPRIRITAESHKIETPQPAEIKKVEQPAAVAPHWQEIYRDWEKNTVPEPVKQRNDTGLPASDEWIENFPNNFSGLNEPDAEKILIRKKSSLSDIKDNRVLVLFLSLLVIAMGIWTAYSWSKTSSHNPEDTTHDLVQQTTPPATAIEESSPVLEPSSNATEAVNTEPAVPQQRVNDDEQRHSGVPTANRVTPSVSKNEAVKEPEVKQKITPVGTDVKTPVAATKAEPVVKNESPAISKNTSDVFKKEKASPKIKDYIHVNSIGTQDDGAVGVKYKIENVSQIPVELIMLDLMYYDNNGKYKKGETVYVRNVAPGQTVNVSAPDNADAAKIKYRISMISAEQQGLYLIAD